MANHGVTVVGPTVQATDCAAERTACINDDGAHDRRPAPAAH
jgi:hypothetical protein